MNDLSSFEHSQIRLITVPGSLSSILADTLLHPLLRDEEDDGLDEGESLCFPSWRKAARFLSNRASYRFLLAPGTEPTFSDVLEPLLSDLIDAGLLDEGGRGEYGMPCGEDDFESGARVLVNDPEGREGGASRRIEKEGS